MKDQPSDSTLSLDQLNEQIKSLLDVTSDLVNFVGMLCVFSCKGYDLPDGFEKIRKATEKLRKERSVCTEAPSNKGEPKAEEVLDYIINDDVKRLHNFLFKNPECMFCKIHGYKGYTDGTGLIDFCCTNGAYNCAEYLLKQGVSPSVSDADGCTAAISAATDTDGNRGYKFLSLLSDFNGLTGSVMRSDGIPLYEHILKNEGFKPDHKREILCRIGNAYAHLRSKRDTV